MPRFVPRRSIASTGFVATQLGIGDVADRNLPLEECVRTVRRAMDAGLNVIDTAPAYENGYSEEIVGAALEDRRDGMFVITKIDHHSEPVGPQVDGSLRRLRLDNVDLFVLHGLSTMDGWRAAIAPDGAMRQLRDCVDAGKARFAGISCHDPLVLMEAIRSGMCDVVMFAIGPFVDQRYVNQALPLAKTLGVGTVCFKTFGAGKLLADTTGYNQPLLVRPRGKISSGGSTNTASEGPALQRLTVRQCLHYTLTCDPDVALLGMSFPNEQDAAFQAAEEFTGPLADSEMQEIRRQAAAAIAGKGQCWWNPQSGT